MKRSVGRRFVARGVIILRKSPEGLQQDAYTLDDLVVHARCARPVKKATLNVAHQRFCLLYTSPSPRD